MTYPIQEGARCHAGYITQPGCPAPRSSVRPASHCRGRARVVGAAHEAQKGAH